MRLAMALEGLTRNVGMHAGGVLIVPGKLTDFTPLYCADGSTATVSQFDKDDVEKAGLVKFDFLGLTTLTIIAEAERHIRAMGHPDFDIQAIALDDPAAYKVFSSGNTVAIFQFESRGMRDLIMKARPDRLEDLTALNALYRPGPMELIPEFIERKHGRQRWEYLDPRLKEILDPTYGVMTYQEHVMTIAQVIGGYTLGSADLLRRAMGKKKAEEMAQQRAVFLEGATAARAGRVEGERPLRPDGEVRGLRLQQVALRGLRAGGLPDGLPEGAPSGGLLRGEPLGGHERHRQGAGDLRRRARQRPRGAATRT